MVQHNDAYDDPIITIELDYFNILLEALRFAVGGVTLIFIIDSVPWLRTIIFDKRIDSYMDVFCLFFLVFVILIYVVERHTVQEIKKHQGHGK